MSWPVVARAWEEIIKYCKSLSIRQFPISMWQHYKHIPSIKFVLKTFQFYDFPPPYRYYLTGNVLVLDYDDCIGPTTRIYLEFSGKIDVPAIRDRTGYINFNECDYLSLRSRFVDLLSK